MAIVREARDKAARNASREAKARIKSRREHIAEAQVIFNRWIRARDANLPCISCGRMHQGQWHAGHYLSVGSSPEMRFDEKNVHAQCAPCNNHLSGNAIKYRIGLIHRYGVEIVEYLEGPHPAKKYTIEDILEIKRRYRAFTARNDKGEPCQT